MLNRPNPLARQRNPKTKTLDSENEEAGGSGGQEHNKKRRRHTTRGKSEAKEVPASTASADKQTRVLATHPLTVKVTVKCKDGSCIEFVFTYLLGLEIVTVHVQLTTPTDAPTALGTNGHLLSADNVLSCLYPGDVGSSSQTLRMPTCCSVQASTACQTLPRVSACPTARFRVSEASDSSAVSLPLHPH